MFWTASKFQFNYVLPPTTQVLKLENINIKENHEGAPHTLLTYIINISLSYHYK